MLLFHTAAHGTQSGLHHPLTRFRIENRVRVRREAPSPRGVTGLLLALLRRLGVELQQLILQVQLMVQLGHLQYNRGAGQRVVEEDCEWWDGGRDLWGFYVGYSLLVGTAESTAGSVGMLIFLFTVSIELLKIQC